MIIYESLGESKMEQKEGKQGLAFLDKNKFAHKPQYS